MKDGDGSESKKIHPESNSIHREAISIRIIVVMLGDVMLGQMEECEGGERWD